MKALNWMLPGAPTNLSIFQDVGSGMLFVTRNDAERDQSESRQQRLLSKMRACTQISTPAVVFHDAMVDEAFAVPERLAGKYFGSREALSDIDALALNAVVVQLHGGAQALQDELRKAFGDTFPDISRRRNAGRVAATHFSASVQVICELALQFQHPLSLPPRRQSEQNPDAKSALRDRLFETIPSVDANTWSSRRGNRGVNASAALGKYRKDGKLFALDRGGRYYYPEFQFTDDDLPRPVMKELLAAVPSDAQSWPLLSWFDAPNVHLGGAKPREAIAKMPGQVLMAAQRFYGADE